MLLPSYGDETKANDKLFILFKNADDDFYKSADKFWEFNRIKFHKCPPIVTSIQITLRLFITNTMPS